VSSQRCTSPPAPAGPSRCGRSTGVQGLVDLLVPPASRRLLQSPDRRGCHCVGESTVMGFRIAARSTVARKEALLGPRGPTLLLGGVAGTSCEIYSLSPCCSLSPGPVLEDRRRHTTSPMWRCRHIAMGAVDLLLPRSDPLRSFSGTVSMPYSS
jgi:hypothetical protein